VSGRPGERDEEVEALVVDRYLESLLARRPIDVEDVPVHLEATAEELIRALPRYHPSFTFEEHLAARLAAAAAQAGAATGRIVPFARPDAAADTVDRPGIARPVVIGSVVTSAAISLAGAAFVAWRRTRPGDPMSRAVRAVSRARIA
jgi:hypothetical protein